MDLSIHALTVFYNQNLFIALIKILNFMIPEKVIDEEGESFNNSKLRGSRAKSRKKGNASKLSMYETNL